MARVGRQEQIEGLSVDAEHALGARYGGLWVDHGQGGVVRLAVAGGPPPTDQVNQLAAAHNLTGLAVPASVRFSQATLDAIVTDLGTSLPAANGNASSTIRLGERIDLNAVEVTTPPSGLTADQQRFVDDARARYGDAVRVSTAPDQYVTMSTSCSLRDCDAPIRGGVAIYTGSGRCTSGLLVQEPGLFLPKATFVLTAGHCTQLAGPNWTAKYSDGSSHALGTSADSRFGAEGDFGTVSIGWASGSPGTTWPFKGWIYRYSGTYGMVVIPGNEQLPVKEEPAPRAGAREWVGLAVLALPTLLVSLDMFVMLLALPHISRSLHASGVQQLWIMDVYGFMVAGFMITIRPLLG